MMVMIVYKGFIKDMSLFEIYYIIK